VRLVHEGAPVVGRQPGQAPVRVTFSPNFGPSRPIPTCAVISAPSTGVPPSFAIRLSALRKHAAYPAANSCSGLVFVPFSGPPSSLG
jgi:hypothetical protein